MSESNGQCEFEHLDYCCPPKHMVNAGFGCSKALPIEEGDVAQNPGLPHLLNPTHKERGSDE